MITRLVIATRNRHKVQEMQFILGPRFECRMADDGPEVLEDAPNFAGNASKKATSLAAWLGQSGQVSGAYVLADDSGLEVDALQGAPGVHSARFAASDRQAKNSPDSANNEKLLRLLANESNRTARFRCVLALLAPESVELQFFEGTCEGRIDLSPRGQNGFGYDPLFIPEGFDQSFAQLGEDVKNRISHRSKALGKLRQAIL